MLGSGADGRRAQVRLPLPCLQQPALLDLKSRGKKVLMLAFPVQRRAQRSQELGREASGISGLPCPVWVGAGCIHEVPWVGAGPGDANESGRGETTLPGELSCSREAGEAAPAEVLGKCWGQRSAQLSTAGVSQKAGPVGSENALGRENPGQRLLSAPEHFPEGIP